MNKILMLLFILSVSVSAFSQRILTLKECYEKAYVTAPVAGEKQAYSDIWKLKDKNLVKGWLPTLDANGSFVYNSSVVDMTDGLGSLPVPGIADHIQAMPHEQYRVTLDINQVIYDGGAIKGARALEKADLNINKQQTEADLYKLREQINRYYFNLLLIDRQKRLLQNYLELLNKRMQSVNSALTSGVILKSDIDVLSSEKIKLEQQLMENDIRKISLLKILSDLTGIDIDDSTQLVIPPAEQKLSDELARPELQLFDLRTEQLDASRKLIQSKRMPRAFGFATLGYGNPPGSNFFKDEFAPYYMVGAGLKWNIFDWNKVKNEKQVLSLQQSIIDSRKSDMTDNLKRLLDAKGAEIESLESMLKTDSALIEIRKRITLTAESQYENGVITATDYLNELNDERQAKINYEIHTINLAMARVEYLNISGKEIE
ncbi:MAG: TolC family protein [Bacteroidales bacterium]|nr:TolC family protein [Bacteroidales bacterium]